MKADPKIFFGYCLFHYYFYRPRFADGLHHPCVQIDVRAVVAGVPASALFAVVVAAVADHNFLGRVDEWMNYCPGYYHSCVQTAAVVPVSFRSAVVVDHCFSHRAVEWMYDCSSYYHSCVQTVSIVPVSVRSAVAVAFVADHYFSHRADDMVYSCSSYYHSNDQTGDCCYHFRD
jgi:hypothetical protein